MLRRSPIALKKGWTYTPGHLPRGGKNTAFRPKMSEKTLAKFVPLNAEHPRRRPDSWQDSEFRRLGMNEWPKAVGFFNAGDNFEVAPEMMWRLFGKNQDAAFWSQQHNEQVVVALMPLVEQDPAAHMPKVDAVLRAHIGRFGADHLIYNAAMQAAAFAKDFGRARALLGEMGGLGLVPNAQSYVNMMLAVRLCGKPRDAAVEYFQEGVRTGALQAVMRLDTEFEMWWAQIGRMGSFTAAGDGYLSVNDEGASARPKDMWAIWGWDRDERKFVSRRQFIRYEVAKRTNAGGHMAGTVSSGYKREPWHKYHGMLPYDFKGPLLSAAAAGEFAGFFDGRPPHAAPQQSCGTAY
jgi:hypothetical protein